MDAATAQILQYPAESALAAFLGLYHEVAAGQKGVFVVGSVIPHVERPAKGAKSPPLRSRVFSPGKIDAMSECVAQLRETANVYFGPALMPMGILPGTRGKEGDIVAVLALVLDEDADKGEQVTLPPGIEPSLIVETSTAPAVNRQVHFVYDKPLARAEAVELAKLALRKCGGDHGGGDVTHIWRLPETLNHPDWKKVEERGRPREAQAVRLVGGSRRVVAVAELRRALESMPDLKPAAALKTAAEWQGGGEGDRGVLMQRLTPKLRGAVHTEPEGERSTHTYRTMLALFESGLTDAEALTIATGAPFARKYWERGDLVAEIGRLRAAWVAKGSNIRGAAAPRASGNPPNVGDADAGGELTQDSVALAFARQFKGRLRYCHTAGSWFVWTESHWQQDETRVAFEWTRTITREMSRGSLRAEMKEVRRANFCSGVERFAQGDDRLKVTHDAWNQDLFLLGAPGGTVDLKTGRQRPAKPEDGITRITAVDPAEAADCPLWLRFLEEATGNDAGVIRFIQQYAGYCLSGDVREQQLVFIHGDGGNGKGVLMRVFQGIMNTYAATAAMDTFTASKGDKHPTDLAMLNGPRLVSASETEEGKSWAEARIKTMTGGDPITAHFMRRDNFTYMPQFKLLIIGNHKPELKNIDRAIRRRFNFVPFVVTPKKEDLQLETKLREEWPEILRWMIEGCLDWQRNGLVRPKSIVDDTKAYFDEQDVFGQWLGDRCDIDPARSGVGWKFSSSSLFANWKDYAISAGEDAGSLKGFSTKLARRGLQKVREPNYRGFQGIRIKQIDHQTS